MTARINSHNFNHCDFLSRYQFHNMNSKDFKEKKDIQKVKVARVLAGLRSSKFIPMEDLRAETRDDIALRELKEMELKDVIGSL